MKKKKRLSVLTISMGAGGAERVINRLLPYWKKEYDVNLVLFYDIRHYTVPEDVPVTVLSKANTSALMKPVLFFSYFLKYNRFIRESGIDVSLSFLTRPNLINGLVGLFNRGLKTISSERCYPSATYKSHFFRYALYKILIPLLYNRCTLLFSNSVHINKDLKKNFGVKIPMHVIYNPIDKDARVLETSEQFFSRKPFNIVNVGSIYQPKNQQLLVDAMGELKGEDSICTFIGDGVLRRRLEESVSEKSLSGKVIFQGKVNDVFAHLNSKHCFILTSDTEGFPNVLLEAMVIGLPVISTNCMSGPLELLNDNEPVTIADGGFYLAKYGILINVGDRIGLVNAITFLQQNFTVWEKYSRLGRQKADEFTVERIAGLYSPIID